MRAQEITFLKLVQGEKQFQVPLYQRTYSWGREQLQRLWDDLEEVVDHHLSGHALAAHFLGSVVLAPGKVQAGGVQRWLVVDGQQRLTTLMLAFAALRDHYKENGDTAAWDRVQRQILVNEFHGGLDHYRLLPTQADRDSFLACVSATPQAGGGDNIGAAYRFFRGALAKGQEERNGDTASWHAAVEASMKDLLSIVEITAESGDNVYRIFESINNTGVGLSQTDLLRNYIFMLLPTSGEKVYHELWLPMQQLLGPANLELLAWLDLVVRGHNRAKQGDVYREQQARLDKLAPDEKALEDEVRQLYVRAQQLDRILNPGKETAPALRTALERLASWGARLHYPLALHLLGLVDTGTATAEDAAQALAYLESYLVRRMICQVSTTGLNRILSDAPKELETDCPPHDAVRRFLSRRRRNWPTDRELRDAIAHKPFYWGGRPEQRSHVLRRLEESHGATERVDFTTSKLTVEHILPQKPAPAWFEQLAEETEGDETPHELHDRLVHTLGNLTLSGDNAKLSNHPFHRKQEIYDSSVLKMNQEIAAEQRWGKAEILARAERLTEQAITLWPGPIGAVRDANDEWAGWADLRAALVAMPSGTWTTYGDVAELIGSHAVPVGSYLGGPRVIHGAHRVLTSDGRVSPGFRWPDGVDLGSPQELLTREGVTFDTFGRANPTHRLRAAELAVLMGRDVPQDTAADQTPLTDSETAAAATRFEALLRQHQPDSAISVLGALRFWQQQGGHCDYGRATETSCFPVLDPSLTGRPQVLWPLALYPVTGTAEVVFQYLKDRSPFDDIELRRELLRRLNEIEGIDLPEAKLELRPSFPLSVFVEGLVELCGVMEWFAHTAALEHTRQA